MSAPPTIDVMHAVQARVTSECAGVGGGVPVALTAPLKLDPAADRTCYILHMHPPDDLIKVAGAIIQRTHTIQIRLWMRTPDDTAETTFLALGDAISFAFFQDQRLGGIANSAKLTVPNAAPYIELNGTIYRQRVWDLEIVQQFQVTMQ